MPRCPTSIPRARSLVRRTAVVAVGAALVLGLVGMHALVAADVVGASGAPGRPTSAVSSMLPGVDETSQVLASAWHSTVHVGEHASHGVAGNGHSAAGACLALLTAIALLVLARAARRGLRLGLPGGDDLAALAVSLATRRRPAARPDLHALSILRC